MKIVLLHGDDSNASYARLTKFIEVAKERNWEVNFLEYEEKIEEKLRGSSLFAKESLFVLRGVNKFPKGSIKKLLAKALNYPGNLVIYHSDTLSKEILSSFPNEVKVEEFKLPRIIFDFLDSFYPGNARASIRLLKEITKREPAEFVFALLAKHLRDLFWVKEGNSIPYPSWRVGKLKKQASKFEVEQIKKIINYLAELDIKVKTSEADLPSSLDLVIVSLLE